MRLLCVTLALGALMAGQAAASSFVHIAPPGKGESPSIVMLGEPAVAHTVSATPDVLLPIETATSLDGSLQVPLAFALPDMRPESAIEPVFISASIIAYDAPVPPVTFEKVAAIAVKPARVQSTPMVIRGGIVGSAFERIVVPDAEPAAKPPAGNQRKARAEQERRTASDGSTPEGNRTVRRQRQPAKPEDAPQPPAVEATPMPTGPTSAPQ